MKKILIV